MHIGLIGGIGVAATIVYYQRLVRAVEARGAALDLTIVHGDVHELIRNNTADAREAQADVFAGLIDRLAAAGADCAAITSIGGHFCFAETVARASLPLVSGVAPLDAHFVGAGVRRIGLLGTRVVMRTRLYGQLERTEAVILDDAVEEIATAYMEMAASGVCTEAKRALFVEAGRRMVAEHGAEAIVLAGTDLALAFEGVEPGYPVIDAVDVHVSALADLAAGVTRMPSGVPA